MLPRRTIAVGPLTRRDTPGTRLGEMRTRACTTALGCVREKIAYPCAGVKSATTERPGLSRVPAVSAGPELARGGVTRRHLLPGPQEALGVAGRDAARDRERRDVGLGRDAALR